MYIHLDPRAETVQVPAWFKKQPQLVLQVGLNMPVPIRDLNVDDSGISCTLSFSRSPFFCVIPWAAVFALVGENGQAMVWAEDVPAEVAAQAQAQKAPEKPRSHLRSVGEGESAPPAAPAPVEAAEKKASTKVGKASAKTKTTAEGGKRTTKAAAKPKVSKVKAAPNKVAKADSPAKAPELAPTAPVAAARPEPAKQARPEPARAASPTTNPTSDGQKPKRELPPYLRVVK